MNFCGFCSNVPGAGDFAYETFKKVPTVGGLFGNLSQLMNIGKGLGNLGNLGGITNMIGGGGFGGLSNMIGGGFNNMIGGQGMGGQINGFSGNGGNAGQGLNINQFVNNNPSNSIKANEDNFNDLIANNSGSVIKKVLKSNYNELNEEHKKSGQKFTDPQFPPDQSSIGNVEGIPVRATWKRIPDIIKNSAFVVDNINPADILQGSLGDCYFLSAIAALAENDFRIKNLFPNLEMNPYGIYMARVYHQGVLKEVVVDDYVPVDGQGDPLFAKPAGGRQIWVMILEKCWAKLNGSYGAIVGGLPNEVLHAFSGAPTFYNQVPTTKQGQDQLWNKMWNSYSQGGLLCTGTKGEDEIEKYGFVKGHAYTILGLYQQPQKIVKLRNPWGEKQWSGRASDSDQQFWANISPADKQKMGWSNKNDGIFFMLWEDFVNYYDMVDICKLNDNASYTTAEAQFDKKNGQMFQFDTSGGNTTVSLSQPSTRGKSQQIQDKGYSRSTLIVGKQEQAGKGYEYKYIASSSNKLFSEHNLQLGNLPKGHYVIYAKQQWINNNPQTASVSVYSETPVNVIKSKQSKHPEFLYKVFLDHARKNNKKQNIGGNDWFCQELLLNECGYGYIACHLDDNSNRKVGIQINQSEYIERRFQLKKPYRGKGQIKTSVEPGKELMILFKIKSQTYPNSVTLPQPKLYNLV